MIKVWGKNRDERTREQNTNNYCVAFREQEQNENKNISNTENENSVLSFLGQKLFNVNTVAYLKSNSTCEAYHTNDTWFCKKFSFSMNGINQILQRIVSQHNKSLNPIFTRTQTNNAEHDFGYCIGSNCFNLPKSSCRHILLYKSYSCWPSCFAS